jgi:hypothetical protein
MSKKLSPDVKQARAEAALATRAARFVSQARAAHGDTYNYSQAVYTSKDNRVTIVCVTHGPFEQSPSNHWKGQGCRKCARLEPLTTESFIVKAHALHGQKYHYDKIGCVNRNTAKVLIGCAAHGLFEQRIMNHLAGRGCPVCGMATTRMSWVQKSRGVACILYLLRVFKQGEEFYKIGITNRTIQQRFSRPSTRHGYEIEIIAQYKSTNAAAVFDWEQSIIETFAHLRYRPKISFGGETECFSSCEEILEIFPL